MSTTTTEMDVRRAAGHWLIELQRAKLVPEEARLRFQPAEPNAGITFSIGLTWDDLDGWKSLTSSKDFGLNLDGVFTRSEARTMINVATATLRAVTLARATSLSRREAQYLNRALAHARGRTPKLDDEDLNPAERKHLREKLDRLS